MVMSKKTGVVRTGYYGYTQLNTYTQREWEMYSTVPVSLAWLKWTSRREERGIEDSKERVNGK